MTNVSLPRLHLVGPLDTVNDAAFIEIATAAALGGVDAVHVRLPGRPAADVFDIARQLKAALPVTAALIVNDRIDVAMAVSATGVQLGERSLPVDAARAVSGSRLLLGRSIHDVDGARNAAELGTDYLLAGNVFATASHPGAEGRGLDWLAKIVETVSIPVIAIGGITSKRIAEVIATGAYGVAVGREILLAPNPQQAAEDLRIQLK